MEYKAVLETVVAATDLSQAQMTTAMNAIMDGELTPAQVAGLLVALRMKGETVEEIAGAAASMRDHATYVDAGSPPIVDIVGTGGDNAHTFNVSTAAAFIAAGAGVKIAKHGNRSVSSKCGSADVLKALGVNIELTPENVGACIREVGIGYLFAPMLHGAMKHAIGPRRELGVRTMFNMLGPLTNPARATALVIGVYNAELTRVFAGVLQQLGVHRALVVHGDDGLDEITGTTTTTVSELKQGEVEHYTLDPREYIEDYCDPADLVGGEPVENAGLVRAVLDGEEGPRRRVAQLNAAAGIYVEGLAEDMQQAYELARASVDDGNALNKLAAMAEFTQAHAP